MNIRRSIAAGALAAGSMFLASPAQAAPIVVLPGGGLVDVTIVDAVDIDRVTVQLPIAVAANVCNVDVSVLTGAVADGITDCTADADARGQNRN